MNSMKKLLFLKFKIQVTFWRKTKNKYTIISGDFSICQVENSLKSEQLFDIFNVSTNYISTSSYTSYSSLDYIVINIPGNNTVSNFNSFFSDHHCQISNFSVNYGETPENFEILTVRNIKSCSLNEFSYPLLFIDTYDYFLVPLQLLFPEK